MFLVNVVRKVMSASRKGNVVVLLVVILALHILWQRPWLGQPPEITPVDEDGATIELVQRLHHRIKEMEKRLQNISQQNGCQEVERLNQELTSKLDNLERSLAGEPSKQAVSMSNEEGYRSPFKRPTIKLAIVVPLYRPMWGRSVESFKNWRAGYNTPACQRQQQSLTDEQRSPANVDLILYTNKWYGGSPEANEQKLSYITGLLKEAGMDRCFDTIRFVNAGLDNSTDPEKGRNNRAISEFFFALFFNTSLTADGYDYFFHMETDTRPIRPLWVDRLYEEVSSRLTPFWVMGSIYRGGSHPRAFCYGKFSGCAEHINGNAIFNLQDRNFTQWLQEIHEEYVRGNHHSSWGFDTYIINVLKKETNWPFLQEWIHKFVYTDLIQHGQWMPRKQVLERFPNTYLTHQTIDG